MVNQIELQKQAKRARRSRSVSVAPSGFKIPLEWSTGPFECCCADCLGDIYSCCCFPCAFGAISRNLDNTSMMGVHCCSACFCPCCIACTVAPGRRARIRHAWKLPADPCKGKNIMAKMEEGTEVLDDRRKKYQAEKEQAPGSKSDELPANNSKPGRSRRGSNFIGTHGNLVGTRDARGNIIR